VDDQKQNGIAGQLRTWAASGTLFQRRHDVQAYPARLGEQWRLVSCHLGLGVQVHLAIAWAPSCLLNHDLGWFGAT
jgi:hypothetical protein